jgi:hypothetical protein
MIRVDVEQGSPEWERARIGMPTASGFDQILTPSTLKLSKSSDRYRNQILAEWLLGYSIDFSGRYQDLAFIERGRRMEAEARAWYEMHFGVDVPPGGFIMRDDEKVGGSPDGLVGEDGGVEFKVPAIHTHIGYLLKPEKLEAEYAAQVQGYLYLSARLWWDVVSYHPDLPTVVRRVQRNSEFIIALDASLDAFIEELDAAKAQLEPHKLALVA